MGYGLEIYNEDGKLILSSDSKLSGIVQTKSVGAISTARNLSSLGAPSFIDKSVGIPNLSPNVDDYSSTFLKFNNYACLCGGHWVSENSGTYYYCNQNYAPESGYVDIYDSSGKLVWSAKSAGMMPMISEIISLTASELVNGFEKNISSNAILLNNLPTVYYPAAMGNSAAGGLYLKFSDGKIRGQYLVNSTNNVSNLDTYLGGKNFIIMLANIF